MGRRPGEPEPGGRNRLRRLWGAPAIAAMALGTGVPAAGFAQEPVPMTIDTVVESALMNETRPVRVIVSPGCENGGCPMVIVMDAEFLLPMVAGVHAMQAHRYVARAAPAVLVGVRNLARLRDVTPTPTEQYPEGGGADLFLDFLVEELTPAIAVEWGTVGDPVLIGHSGSGIVVLAALDRMPDRFSGLVAIDPSADWDEDEILKRLDASARTTQPSRRLPFTLDTYRHKPLMGDVMRRLEQRGENLEWTVFVHEGETHQTLPLPAVRRALPLMIPVSNGND